MPIKIPKSFGRRKSSGNALEEVENPREPSFRVFERPPAAGGSFDSVNAAKRASEGNPLHLVSSEPDNIFADLEKHHGKNRGSRATNNSDSTAPYDSSSSARYSSSSTLPSTDAPIHKESRHAHARPFHDIPLPPAIGSQFSFRAAGRTFSFGTKAPRVSTPPSRDSAAPSTIRDRAMTASTDSTATPPRLLESDLKLEKSDDGFGNMFEHFGKSKNASARQRSSKAHNEDAIDQAPPVPAKGPKAARLTPIAIDRWKDVEPSPYSCDSRNSQDGLLETSGQEEDNMFASRNLTQSNSMTLTEGRRSSTPSNSMPLPTTTHRALDKPARDQRLRRSTAYTGRRGSSPIDDADVKLALESVSLNSQSQQTPAVAEDKDETSSLFDSKDADFTSTFQNWRQGQSTEADDADDIVANARLAAQYENKEESSVRQTGNKVMTPAQFERYRQQRELTRTVSDASRSDASDGSNDYDDEDETEMNREAARQRSRQEAHLSVYRQQMMKVTGEQPTVPPLRPNVDQASSTPNLVSRMSTLELPVDKSGSGKSSDADEDDDIPLAILAAHGFPNKNRPPTHLSSASSIPNLRASFNASPASVAGDGSGNRGSLPPFARNLPRDPYFGASLVLPSNRESLAMGGGASVYGGPSPALPPGGLVGVIATEERARAMRRGSPNTQAFAPMGPSPGGLPRPHTMMNMGPAFMPPPQPVLSPAEQAQIQVSQQMTQMMQMQMNWMQSMMQMQAMQNAGQPPPMINSNLTPPMPAANMRPMSMPPTAVLNNPPPTTPRQVDQRTLSMLDPSMSARWNNIRPLSSNGVNGLNVPQGQGYAPSIAPSERSNVGLAPRYRPVSTIQPDQKPANRASTFTSSTLKPWNDENQIPPLSTLSPRSNSARPTSMATLTVRPIGNAGRTPTPSRNIAAEDDDDDEEGWAELMKQREKKKSGWRMKRETTSNLGELLHAVH